MITLYHCFAARSFRPLWMLEEMGNVPYELKMLPFPPRMFAKEYLGINPLGFGVIGALLNFGTAYVVAGMTKPTPAAIQELVENVRVPRQA